MSRHRLEIEIDKATTDMIRSDFLDGQAIRAKKMTISFEANTFPQVTLEISRLQLDLPFEEPIPMQVTFVEAEDAET